MPIKIQLYNYNNNYEYNNYEYNCFQDIPTEYYTQIKVLKCNSCNLNNIDFIANFTNLTKLNASDNKIKIIPIISSLEELEIYNNQLEELPILINLKILYAFNNKLTYIPKLQNLEIIDVSHNNIINITCYEKVKKLYISYNKLINIELKGTLLTEIECNNNQLKNINFIECLNKLNKLNYSDNNISYTPPHVLRFIPGNVYSNKTNSLHQININTKIRILKMVSFKPTMNLHRLKCDIINNSIISSPAKTILFTCLESHYIEPTIRLTFLEFCLNYWSKLKINSNNVNNEFNLLNNALITNKCKCISCMFKDLMDVISIKII